MTIETTPPETTHELLPFICPLMSISTEGYCDCVNARCAWWDGEYHRCAMLNLSRLAHCIEGSRVIDFPPAINIRER